MTLTPELQAILAVAITGFAPVITEGVKYFVGHVVPKAALPIVAGVAGTALALLSDATAGTDFGLIVGAVLGLASTGLRDIIHIARQDGAKAAKASALGAAFLGLTLLAGCTPAMRPNIDAIAPRVGAAAGSIGCAAAVVELRPSEVGVMSEVMRGIKTVLDSNELPMSQLNVLLLQLEHPVYRAGASVLLSELNTYLDDSDVLSFNSPYRDAVSNFVNSCLLALGVSESGAVQESSAGVAANAVKAYEATTK